MADDRWEDISNVDYYSELQNKIPGVRFTSGYRTPEYQEDMRRRGYHPAEHSGHLDGSKMDILPPEGKDMAWLKQQITQLYPYAKINPNEGDHADVYFPGWHGAPALGGAVQAGVANPNRPTTGPAVEDDRWEDLTSPTQPTQQAPIPAPAAPTGPVDPNIDPLATATTGLPSIGTNDPRPSQLSAEAPSGNFGSVIDHSIARQGGWGISPETAAALGADPSDPASMRNIPAKLADSAWRIQQAIMVGGETAAHYLDEFAKQSGIADALSWDGNKFLPGSGFMALAEAFPLAGAEAGLHLPAGKMPEGTIEKLPDGTETHTYTNEPIGEGLYGSVHDESPTLGDQHPNVGYEEQVQRVGDKFHDANTFSTTDIEQMLRPKTDEAPVKAEAPAPEPKPTAEAPKLPDWVDRAPEQVDNLTKDWKNRPDIQVVKSVDDITDPDVKQSILDGGAEEDVQGLVDKNGKTWIIAGNHASPEELTGTVFHEALGHKGLDSLFGEKKDAELHRLYDGNTGLKEEVDKWMDDNGHTLAESDDPLSRGIEEVLAYKSEKGQLDPTMLARLRQMVKTFARRAGLKLAVTDAEVTHILGMAHRRITKGGKIAEVDANGNRFMYGGIKSKGMTDAMDKGQDFFGPDGNLRHEFSDENAKLNDRWENLPESSISGEVNVAKLGDVLDHPELFKNYPDAKNIDVVKQPGIFDFGGLQGSFDEGKNRLQITPYAKDPLSTSLHEIQHWIQGHENFARGGNSETALHKMPLEKLSTTAAETWSKWRGEALQLNQKASFLEDLKKSPAFDRWTEARKNFHENEDKIGSPERVKVYNELKNAEDAFIKDTFGVEKTSDLSRSQKDEMWSLQSAVNNMTGWKKGLDAHIGNLRNASEKASIRANDIDAVDWKDPKAKPELVRLLSKDREVAHKAYQSLFGEVEARDTQRRQMLTNEERQTLDRYKPLPDNVSKEMAHDTKPDDHIDPKDYIYAYGDGISEDRFARKSQRPKEDDNLAGNIRLDKLLVGKDIRSIIQEAASRVPKGAVTTEAEIRKLAKAMKIDPKEVKPVDAAHAYAARQALVQSARKLKTLSTRIAKGENSDIMLQKLGDAIAEHVSVQAHVSDIARNAGQVLRQFRMQARANVAAGEGMRFSTKSAMEGLLGDAGSLQQAAEIIARTPEDQLVQRTRKIVEPKWYDGVMSWRLNSMLSGPNTFFNNHKGNALAFGLDYGSHALTPSTWKELGPRAIGAFDGMISSFRPTEISDGMGGKRTVVPIAEAWKNGVPPELVSKAEQSNIYFKGPITGLVETPKRLLAASDQFWRGVVKSSEVRGLAVRTAYQEGARGAELGKRVRELIDDPTEAMMNMSVDKQAKLTFLDEPSAMTRKLSQITHIGPKDSGGEIAFKLGVKMILPITRVPDRLLAWALRWSPAGVLSKDFKAGGFKRKQAIGRAVVGTAFYGYAAYKAMNGELTGSKVGDSYSKSEEERANGKGPYQIKINGEWHSYQGWDPLSIPLALVAEAHDAATRNEDDTVQEKASAAIIGIAKATMSSTWTQDLQSVLSAFGSKDGTDTQMLNTIGQMAASFVPFSGASRQVQQMIDDRPTDKRGDSKTTSANGPVANQVKDVIPGLRQTLPVQHDVYGREVHRNIPPDNSDPTIKELMRLSALSDKPLVGKIAKEKDETAEHYQERAYYAGQYVVAKMAEVINSPSWKTMSDPDKYKTTKRIVSQMHKLAKETTASSRWEEVK